MLVASSDEPYEFTHAAAGGAGAGGGGGSSCAAKLAMLKPLIAASDFCASVNYQRGRLAFVLRRQVYRQVVSDGLQICRRHIDGVSEREDMRGLST